jgi:putative acetyltransferase
MINIREFRERDFGPLVALWHATNLLSYPYVREHQEHTLADARHFFRSKLLRDCRVWVAESAGQLKGLLALSDSWIRQLVVFSAFQRQGVGTALLTKAQVCSPANLRLHTFQRNIAARTFYEHHGFTVVALGTSPAPESEPDVEYVWQAASLASPTRSTPPASSAR